MLKLIESNFSNSSMKVKLQLFILPLFIMYFYFYFVTSNNKLPSLKTSTDLNLLVNKKFNKSHLELINDLEKYFISKKIKVTSIDYKNKSLLIRGNTSIVKIKSLINKLEAINNFSNIALMNISKTKRPNVYNFEINTEFKKYYIKEKRKIKEKTLEIVKKTKKKIKLKAIVSNHILVNNKWYSINDKVGKYKISEVTRNRVLLTYEDEKLYLKLHKNE